MSIGNNPSYSIISTGLFQQWGGESQASAFGKSLDREVKKGRISKWAWPAVNPHLTRSSVGSDNVGSVPKAHHGEDKGLKAGRRHP
jgi:hypothetical protein